MLRKEGDPGAFTNDCWGALSVLPKAPQRHRALPPAGEGSRQPLECRSLPTLTPDVFSQFCPWTAVPGPANNSHWSSLASSLSLHLLPLRPSPASRDPAPALPGGAAPLTFTSPPLPSTYRPPHKGGDAVPPQVLECIWPTVAFEGTVEVYASTNF